MANEGRQRWFARILRAGLEEEVLVPSNVLSFVTPDVLANHLPSDVMGQMLSSSLSAGAMTPERVLETVTPEVMAEYIPHEVLWKCVVAAAEDAGISREG